MTKRICTVAIVVFLSVTLASAEEGVKEARGKGVFSWFAAMQKKIAQIVPKKTLRTSNSVAGVRGAREDSRPRLYWKGKEGEEPVSEDELHEFKECIELASKGDKTGAISELQEFMKQYPDSALIPDAKKSLDLVKAEEK